METRAAAALLSEMATLLELRGESPSRSRALRKAVRAILPLDDSELPATLAGIDDETLALLREVDENGDSDRLHLLRETTPEGLHVLNARDVAGVLAFASGRRQAAGSGHRSGAVG